MFDTDVGVTLTRAHGSTEAAAAEGALLAERTADPEGGWGEGVVRRRPR